MKYDYAETKNLEQNQNTFNKTKQESYQAEKNEFQSVTREKKNKNVGYK